MVLNSVGLTGATGMLGRHVWAALEDAGISGISASWNGHIANGTRRWELTNWLGLEELDKVFPRVQAVIHAGAMVPQSTESISDGAMFDANVRSCVNLGLWCISRNVPLVYVSGAIAYTEGGFGDLDENAPTGGKMLGGFYGLSKLLAEDALRRLHQQGLRLAVVRPSSIYGFGLHETKMVSRFLAKAKAGSTIVLAPPVNDRIDLVHAADVALAILAILDAQAWDTFNIASGCSISVEDLAKTCVSVVGRGSVFVEDAQTKRHNPTTRFALDIGRAKRRLNWRPLLDIRRGLSMMLREAVFDNSCSQRRQTQPKQ